MNKSIGKLRGLQQLAEWKGTVIMCAIDHRGALKRALNEKSPDAVSYQNMVDFKLDLCQSVASFASAILLDPEYGAGQAIVAGLFLGSKGLLVSMEKTGYSGRQQCQNHRASAAMECGEGEENGSFSGQTLGLLPAEPERRGLKTARFGGKASRPMH